MNLKGIIAISGRPGIFKVITQGKNSVIVESILDKKRFPAHATEKISTLSPRVNPEKMNILEYS